VDRRSLRAISTSSFICTGPFIFAAVGLLDGKDALMHWHFCDHLAKEFPKVKVRPEPTFLLHGSVYTSAGITAGIDLSLALVKKIMDVGKPWMLRDFLVMFLVRPRGQAQFSHICFFDKPWLFGRSENCRYGCWRI
jgi:transcriptional regulator GlxA family with amidase domain